MPPKRKHVGAGAASRPKGRPVRAKVSSDTAVGGKGEAKSAALAEDAGDLALDGGAGAEGLSSSSSSSSASFSSAPQFIEVIVGGKRFPHVCRQTLSASSAYFAALFNSAFQDATSSVVVVDRDPDAFPYLLSWIRCGHIFLPPPPQQVVTASGGNGDPNMLAKILVEAEFFGMEALLAYVRQKCMHNFIDNTARMKPLLWRQSAFAAFFPTTESLISSPFSPAMFFRPVSFYRVLKTEPAPDNKYVRLWNQRKFHKAQSLVTYERVADGVIRTEPMLELPRELLIDAAAKQGPWLMHQFELPHNAPFLQDDDNEWEGFEMYLDTDHDSDSEDEDAVASAQLVPASIAAGLLEVMSRKRPRRVASDEYLIFSEDPAYAPNWRLYTRQVILRGGGIDAETMYYRYWCRGDNDKVFQSNPAQVDLYRSDCDSSVANKCYGRDLSGHTVPVQSFSNFVGFSKPEDEEEEE